MEQAHQIASEKATKTSTKGKRQFDKNARAILMKVGDRVLVRNLRETGGPGKIKAYWKKDIYIVTKQKGANVPVYEVTRKSGLVEYFIVTCCFNVHIPLMKAKMTRVKNKRQLNYVPQRLRRPTQCLRRPPERLAYYVLGQPGYVQSTAVCTVCAQRFQPQFPYTPASYWPQPTGMVYLYVNFPPYGNSYMLY